MEFLELAVESRSELGKAAVGKLRKSGMVPAVVYSKGMESTSISMNTHDFTMSARGAARSQMFRFKCTDDGAAKQLNGTVAFVKDLQLEPIKEQLLHVDFLSVQKGQTVTVKVAVSTKGDSAAVREGRAMLNQTAYEILVECLPEAIPEALEVDVSGLSEGDSVIAGDIALPEGVELRSSGSASVVSLLSTKKARMAEEKAEADAAAAAAVAAGTPAEGAEGGDAPAADGEKKEPDAKG